MVLYKKGFFTKQEIDNTLVPDFQQWIRSNLNNQNYSNNTFYNTSRYPDGGSSVKDIYTYGKLKLPINKKI